MNIRRNLLACYWSVRKALAPTLRYSQYLYEDMLRLHVKPGMAWLDLGCGRHLLPAWRSDEEKLLVQNCRMMVGVDHDLPSLRDHVSISLKVRGDITNLPFKGRSFALVTANMVVEHLHSPVVQFREVSRILRPGGLFIFHTPNAHGYTRLAARLIPERLKGRLAYLLQGRRGEDVFPTHYRANTAKSIRELAEAAGFEVVSIKMLVSDAALALIVPLAALELVWIRMLMTRPLKPLRTNIIAVLRTRER